VSEALHVPYQRDNRARWIITADLARMEDGSGARSVCAFWRAPDRRLGDAPLTTPTARVMGRSAAVLEPR
jgi:hypothetical protein